MEFGSLKDCRAGEGSRIRAAVMALGLRPPSLQQPPPKRLHLNLQTPRNPGLAGQRPIRREKQQVPAPRRFGALPERVLLGPGNPLSRGRGLFQLFALIEKDVPEAFITGHGPGSSHDCPRMSFLVQYPAFKYVPGAKIPARMGYNPVTNLTQSFSNFSRSGMNFESGSSRPFAIAFR